MSHLTLTPQSAHPRNDRNSFLTFQGDPPVGEVDAIRCRATELIGHTSQMLVLNCSSVHHIGTAGVELLRDISQVANDRSIDVVLSEACLQLRQTLVRSDLLRRCDLADRRSCTSVMLSSV